MLRRNLGPIDCKALMFDHTSFEKQCIALNSEFEIVGELNLAARCLAIWADGGRGLVPAGVVLVYGVCVQICEWANSNRVMK